jgi:hypothetical protein
LLQNELIERLSAVTEKVSFINKITTKFLSKMLPFLGSAILPQVEEEKLSEELYEWAIEELIVLKALNNVDQGGFGEIVQKLMASQVTGQWTYPGLTKKELFEELQQGKLRPQK